MFRSSHPLPLGAFARAGLILLLVLPLALWPAGSAAALGTDISGPAGSDAFGSSVTVLANGNLVITDPLYDQGSTPNVGAVYLYDAWTLDMISVLVGTTAEDQVGSEGVTALPGGNFLVRSSLWDNGAAVDAGAITWGSGTTGVNGPVSAANSLVGSSSEDYVGFPTVLPNGNYLISSASWDNGAATNAGAITWGSGTTGVNGPVSAANSLVGSSSEDYVGWWPRVLANGNYVVMSSQWNNGALADAGAATWASGTTGIAGTISAANSLVGSSAGDRVGWVEELANGNYVVMSSTWTNGAITHAGAVTWADGTAGITGTINRSNSLIGSSTEDRVGNIVALTDGNYVVDSMSWDYGGIQNAGAVTWANGTTGITGTINGANSLVGRSPNDQLDDRHSVMTLPNGGYVVRNPGWDNGAADDAGAVTWGEPGTGVRGFISAGNSLVGTAAGNRVGNDGLTVLTNGNYVVRSSLWDDGTVANVGAATWGSGTAGIRGPLSAANSLIGSSADDWVGSSVTPLANGNYVVSSSYWRNGASAYAGAVTWGNGTTGITGTVSASNSFVGSSSWDEVGGVTPLTNGNYVVSSSYWHNGPIWEAGAAAWANGATGITGTMSITNSLVGSSAEDHVGYVIGLPNGNYLVHSWDWDNGAISDAGAVTWVDGTTGITGTINPGNSLVGSSANDWVGLAYGKYVARPPRDNGPAGADADLSGEHSLHTFSDSSYVVISAYWNNGAAINAGAVTWNDGTAPITGTVNPGNSLVGSSTEDRVGWRDNVSRLDRGRYLVTTPGWDNGAIANAGAVTLSSGPADLTGPIDPATSIVGLVAGGGSSFQVKYDTANQLLVVGRPAENLVTVVRFPFSLLRATADGPTALGNPTTFSAKAFGGSDLTYAWSFGDGSTGSGASPTHTYAAPGSYTATVTATNPLGSATASTTVVVISRSYLPLIRKP